MRFRFPAFVLLLAVGAAPLARAQQQGGATYAPYGTATATATASPYGTYAPPPPNAPNPYGAYPSPPPGYYAPQPAPNAPKQLDYEEGQPIPPGYHLKEKARVGPIVAGSCTFGVLWLISVFASTIGTALGDDRMRDLWIPVAGPFITLSRLDKDDAKPTLAIDGVGQAFGLGFMIYGIASPKTVLLRNDLAEVHVIPMMNARSAGLGLGGVF